MRRPRLGVVLLLGFVFLAVAACGATAKPLSLKARVIGRGDFRGYTPETRLSFNTPKAWLSGDPTLTPDQRKTETARLTGEGFKKDLTEFLYGPQGSRSGLSGVMELGSASAARTELAAELRFYVGQGEKRFPVNTIPGAVGYRSSSAAGGGENLLFTDGPFLYSVGYGWLGTLDNPKHSALINAATKLYSRVHGHPAS